MKSKFSGAVGVEDSSISRPFWYEVLVPDCTVKIEKMSQQAEQDLVEKLEKEKWFTTLTVTQQNSVKKFFQSLVDNGMPFAGKTVMFYKKSPNWLLLGVVIVVLLMILKLVMHFRGSSSPPMDAPM